MKEVSGALKLNLAQYREVESFAQFGSDLDATTRDILEKGSRLIEVLKQVKYNPYPVEIALPILYIGRYGFLDGIPLNQIENFEKAIIYNFFFNWTGIFDQIVTNVRITADFKDLFNATLLQFKQDFLKNLQTITSDISDMPPLRG